MSCCVAILHYLECKHETLIRLGCMTCGNEGTCSANSRHVLLSAKYRLNCMGCLDREVVAIKEKSNEMRHRAQQSETGTGELAFHETKLCHLESMLENHQRARLAEKRRATAWVRSYGETVLELLYGDQVDITEDDEMPGLELSYEDEPNIADPDDGQKLQLEQENQPDIEMTDAPNHIPEARDDDVPGPELSETQHAAMEDLDGLMKTKPADLVIVIDASQKFTVRVPERGEPSEQLIPNPSRSLPPTLRAFPALLQRCQVTQSKTLTSRGLRSAGDR